MDFEKKLFGLFEEEGETSTGAYEVIEQERANQVLSSECSEFEKQQQIFNLIPRDELDNEADFFIYDPLQANKSYDKKYDVMFIDKSTPWDDFPKRKNAIVAYANKDKITEDGVTYIAVPFNSTKLGVAPKPTLEESFNNVSINLGMKFEYFNRSFNILLNIFNNAEGTYEADTKKLHLEGEKYFDNSYGELKQAIARADEQLASDEGKQVVAGILENPFNKETEANVISILEYLDAKTITVQEMVDKLFNPTDNSFKFIGFTDFIVGEHKENEVWFNNKCLLIKESAFDGLAFPSHGDEYEDGETSDEEPVDGEGGEELTDEPTDEEPVDGEGGEELTDEPIDGEGDVADEPVDGEDGDITDEPTDEEPVEDEEDEEDEEDDTMESYKSSFARKYGPVGPRK
jgi:hypothetical protein